MQAARLTLANKDHTHYTEGPLRWDGIKFFQVPAGVNAGVQMATPAMRAGSSPERMYRYPCLAAA